MTEDELATIEARTRHRRIDVALPRCTHDEERGHAPWCRNCDRERQERIGPTFETHGRGDVVALVAEVRRLMAERDAAFNRGVEAMREAAANLATTTARGSEAALYHAECEASGSQWSMGGFMASRIRALKVAP